MQQSVLVGGLIGYSSYRFLFHRKLLSDFNQFITHENYLTFKNLNTRCHLFYGSFSVMLGMCITSLLL